jgi:uncharacterized integral membrane protein (TIGR00697 family)
MSKLQKLDLLLAVYITCIVAAELLGAKLFTINGVINASVAIFVFPITFTINDIVTEVEGKERAASYVRAGFYILVGLAVYTLLAIALPPATRFPDDAAYRTIFAKSLRIILASLAAFYLSERFDIYVFSQIRQKFSQKRLWLRNNLSNFIGQLFDTSIFMFLAFYQLGNFTFVLSIIWPYWLLKCLMSVIETPFTYLGVRWLTGSPAEKLVAEEQGAD